jgi:glutamate racemase
MKIGVFDSGVGGLTVLAELRRKFPAAEFVYLGDTANVPYGTKSAAQIERLSRDGARKLKGKGVDVLVVACNTASSLALDAIRAEMAGVPVVGVVQPGAEAVLKALAPLTPSKSETAFGDFAVPILVLATSATVRSQAYGKTLREILPPDQPGKLPLPIIEQACPLLVPMIEEGWVDHPILHQTIREYVGAHAAGHGTGIALLGCTHYPWVQAAIEKALPGWRVINSAQAVAEALAKQGVAAGAADRKANPGVEWVFTDTHAVPAFARKWIQSI